MRRVVQCRHRQGFVGLHHRLSTRVRETPDFRARSGSAAIISATVLLSAFCDDERACAGSDTAASPAGDAHESQAAAQLHLERRLIRILNVSSQHWRKASQPGFVRVPCTDAVLEVFMIDRLREIAFPRVGCAGRAEPCERCDRTLEGTLHGGRLSCVGRQRGREDSAGGGHDELLGLESRVGEAKPSSPWPPSGTADAHGVDATTPR